MSVLPQVIARNWRIKLAALGLAVFLWAVVTVQPRSQQTLTSIPLLVEVADSGWTLAEPPLPTTVDVRLGGSVRELLQLSRGLDAGVVRVPIGKVTSSDTVVRLRNDWLELDGGSGAVVENIIPATVRLRFEPTRAAALPLSVRTRNDFPEGLALARPIGLTPPVVRVRGAARVVEGLDSIPLEPLDLGTIGESGIYPVRVDTAGLGDLTVEPTSASLGVTLERAVERVIGGVPVTAEPPPAMDPAELVVEPPSIQVTLRGARTPVNQANFEALAAVVAAEDLAGLAQGEARTVPIRLRGVPNMVRAFSAADSVVVRRLPPAGEAPPDTAATDTMRVAPAARPGGVP